MTRLILVFLLFLILSGARTFPLLTHLDTHLPFDDLPYDLLDPVHNVWTWAWDVHALATDPTNLFNANIFYPVKRALAFSDHLLGVVPIFAPAYLLTGNPIFGYNVVFLLSFALSGFAMFCLTYYWTRTFWPSLLAGTLFGFAPIRFAQISRLQLQNFFWAPLAFIFLDRFLRSRRWRDLAALAGFYWLQVFSSVYLGYMTTIAVGLYAGYYGLAIDRSLFRRAIIPKILAFFAGSLVILLPVYLPYVRLSQEWGFAQAMDRLVLTEHYANLSAEPVNYLAVSPLVASVYRSLFMAVDPLAGVNEKWLFPGLVLPALALLGSLSRLEPLALDRVKALRRSLWLILLVAFLLSLGPFLLILRNNTGIPLPYLLFFHLLPGFKVVRVPARFAFLMVLAACPLAALGALKLSEGLRRVMKAGRMSALASPLLSVLLMALALLELGLKPLPLARVRTGKDVPEVYHWLAAERPGPVVELPAGLYQDYAYLYYSTTHWLPLVNGHNVFPPIYPEILEVLQRLPSSRAVEYLKALGARVIVVHEERLRSDELARWSTEASRSDLQKVKTFGSDVVYRIPSGITASRLLLRMSAPDPAPPATRITLRLSLEAPPGESWRHPNVHELSPLTLSPVVVEWGRPGMAQVRQTTKVRLPLVILPDEPALVPVSIETPRTPGTYTLRVWFSSLKAEGDLRTVEIRSASYPTSLNAPRFLSASYQAPAGQSPLSLRGPASIPLSLVVQNTGQAVWLAETQEGIGAVRLGWRWLRGHEEIPGTEGRDLLLYDVFPGESYKFSAVIDTPPEPGIYTLQLGLVSEGVAWFSDLSVPPIRWKVRVGPDAPCHSLDKILATPTSSRDFSFQILIDRSRYRPTRLLNVFLKLGRFEQPREADVYLVLRGPDCRTYFFAYSRDLVTYHGGPWPIFWRGVSLPKASDRPGFRMHAFYPAGLPHGSYNLYLVFAEPNGSRVIGRASATFQLEP